MQIGSHLKILPWFHILSGRKYSVYELLLNSPTSCPSLHLSHFQTEISCACFFFCSVVSHVRLFVTPWTAPCQASLSFPISWCLLKLMSIESVMPSNHLVVCCPILLLPSISPIIRVFSDASGGQSIGASASASVLPMNIQDLFPLELTGWISLQSKGLSRVFYNTTVQKHQIFGAQPSLWSNSHIHT